MPPLLELDRVWKRFARDWVLKDVSLAVEAGEAVALLGPNGVGKTTLLRVAAGLTRPQKGAVRLFGKPAQKVEAERGKLLYLANPPAFYRHLTGEENLKSWLLLLGREADDRAVAEAMARVGLPLSRPVLAYSSGMKKRLALARVFLAGPEILLLDEPETALDEEGRALLEEAIQRVRKGGGAVLLATHDRAFAEAAADREVVLS